MWILCIYFVFLWRRIVYSTKLCKSWQHHLFTRQCFSEDDLFWSKNDGNSIKSVTLMFWYYLFLCKIEHSNYRHLKIWDMFTPYIYWRRIRWLHFTVNIQSVWVFPHNKRRNMAQLRGTWRSVDTFKHSAVTTNPPPSLACLPQRHSSPWRG